MKWELHGLGFIAFQFQWRFNFIMKVLQNIGLFSFKFHHNMIGPLYTIPSFCPLYRIPSFFVFDILMRNILKKK